MGKATKTIILILIAFVYAFVEVSAETRQVTLTIRREGNGQSLNTQIDRVPYNVPVTVRYDEEEQAVRIEADNDITADVYLYDENYRPLFYSSEVNCIIEMSDMPSGNYLLVITNNDWEIGGIVEN